MIPVLDSFHPHSAEQLRDVGWIQTFTGRRFSLFEPKPEDVDILDIAIALSRTARFNGHTRWFYSVAQHSVLASILAPLPLALEALLHDAAEAYTGDIVRPLKILLGSAFGSIEYQIHAAVCERFGLPPAMSPAVKLVDDRLLGAERRDLMSHSAIPWASASDVEPAVVRIQPESFATALSKFCHRFTELTGEPIDFDRLPLA